MAASLEIHRKQCGLQKRRDTSSSFRRACQCRHSTSAHGQSKVHDAKHRPSCQSSNRGRPGRVSCHGGSRLQRPEKTGICLPVSVLKVTACPRYFEFHEMETDARIQVLYKNDLHYQLILLYVVKASSLLHSSSAVPMMPCVVSRVNGRKARPAPFRGASACSLPPSRSTHSCKL